MKRIAFLFLALGGLPAVDVLTVDPTNVVVVAGTAPSAPGTNEVRIGGGRVASTVSFDAYFAGLQQVNFSADAVGAFIQWRQAGKSFALYDDAGVPQVKVTAATPGAVAAGQVAIGNGTVSANNAILTRTTQAAATEVVRGDDPRLSNTRTASGGDATTVQSRAPGAVNGVATLDAAGRVPTAQLNGISGLTVSGTVAATNATVTRTTQAAATEVVRGDDPRLSNARTASGGDATTVQGRTPGAVNGVATLDAAGLVPTAQLNGISGLAVGGTLSATTVNTGALNTTGIATINGAANFLGGSSTGTFVVHTAGTQSIATSPLNSSLEVQSTYGATTEASYISFHRAGLFAAHFGLDTDNVFKIGGWSFGAAAYRVLLGDGYSNVGPLSLTGSLSASNVTISRNSPALATEVVLGNDPRMTDARVAAGGDATTVQTRAPGVVNGLATLDASGKIPAGQLPATAPPRGIQFFTTSGTFTPPAGVTKVIVRAWGGGGGGGSGVSQGAGKNGGGGAFVYASATVTPSQPITVTVGTGGTAGPAQSPTAGSASIFGSIIVANGGTAGGLFNQSPGVGGTGSCTEPGALILPGNNSTSGGSCAINYSGYPGPGGPLSTNTPGQPGYPGMVIVEW